MTELPGARLSLAAKITLLAAVTELVAFIAIVAIVRRDGIELDGTTLAAIASILIVPVVIVYGLTRFVVQRLTVPVIETYQRLALGDFTAELPPMTAGRDFIGLRAGFRAMADALERSLAEIRGADSERRRLFADLAHELATPTTTLLGISAALRERSGDPERLLDLLERESARLERLIADVRDLAALEDPASMLVLEPCDLGALASASVDRIRLAHAGAEVRCEAEDVHALLDPIRVDQILTNLLTNAVRHAEGGKILVLVRRTGANAIIRVEDGGAGVPDEMLPQLGRRLLRVDPSRSRDSGGHGLGLSIVRAIAARHDGTLMFERSQLGGLAAEVRIPIAGPTR
ncbi:MAG: HAMP domain-containing histidine kinase [Myxococcales bacterium]|nr:HAMP domain-containing histidine kinase [Myxococcales bacterium]